MKIFELPWRVRRRRKSIDSSSQSNPLRRREKNYALAWSWKKFRRVDVKA